MEDGAPIIDSVGRTEVPPKRFSTRRRQNWLPRHTQPHLVPAEEVSEEAGELRLGLFHVLLAMGVGKGKEEGKGSVMEAGALQTAAREKGLPPRQTPYGGPLPRGPRARADGARWGSRDNAPPVA